MKMSMPSLIRASLLVAMSMFTSVANAQTSTSTTPNNYDADTRDSQRGFDPGWLGLLGLAGLAGLIRKKDDQTSSTRTGMSSANV